MVKYGVITSYTTSLRTVGSDIVYALNMNGAEAMLFDYLISPREGVGLFEKAIVFIPFDPIYMGSWVLLQRDLSLGGVPTVTYTTVEGRPKERLISKWILRDGVFVANSRFTKRMIEMVGANVIDVIPHGVNMKLVDKIRPEIKTLKKQIGAEVVFGTVATNLSRKGLDKLGMVAAMVKDRCPNAKFYVLTNPMGAAFLKGLDNVVVDTRYGGLKREELLHLIGNFDFYLCTSHAEGFCLPVLEAQALGVPVVYPNFEPISEFTDPSVNFPVNVVEFREEDHDFGLYFLMHYYDVEEMANQVANAYEVYTCSPDEYEKRSAAVIAKAKKYDVVKVYKKFLRIKW